MTAKPGYETAIESWCRNRLEKQAQLKAINENRINMANGVFFVPMSKLWELLQTG
jgi:hypothetical protein